MNLRKASSVAVIAALAFTSYGALANPEGSSQPVTDTVITTKVKAALVQDDTTKARHINVTTRNGVVTLSGAVGSAVEKDAAAQDARKIEGVRSVDNQLTVKQ